MTVGLKRQAFFALAVPSGPRMMNHRRRFPLMKFYSCGCFQAKKYCSPSALTTPLIVSSDVSNMVGRLRITIQLGFDCQGDDSVLQFDAISARATTSLSRVLPKSHKCHPFSTITRTKCPCPHFGC